MGVNTHFTRYVYFSNISKNANITANGFANETANKTDVRGVFQIYPFDFKRKLIALTYYSPLSAILQKNPLFSTGSFCL